MSLAYFGDITCMIFVFTVHAVGMMYRLQHETSFYQDNSVINKFVHSTTNVVFRLPVVPVLFTPIPILNG